jgi:hypothetical protein
VGSLTYSQLLAIMLMLVLHDTCRCVLNGLTHCKVTLCIITAQRFHHLALNSYCSGVHHLAALILTRRTAVPEKLPQWHGDIPLCAMDLHMRTTVTAYASSESTSLRGPHFCSKCFFLPSFLSPFFLHLFGSFFLSSL